MGMSARAQGVGRLADFLGPGILKVLSSPRPTVLTLTEGRAQEGKAGDDPEESHGADRCYDFGALPQPLLWSYYSWPHPLALPRDLGQYA